MTCIARRQFLEGVGSGIFLAYADGVVHVARGAGVLPDGDAYSPWQLWREGSLEGTPLALVAAAVLAANPHDTQPWAFRVTGNEIEVFADLSRNLGAMDARLREMHLGLGCAIQNALLAAPVNGYTADVSVRAGSLLSLSARRGLQSAATIKLEPAPRRAPDSLCRAIPVRHTNRYAYERTRSLPADWLEFARHADVSDDVRMILIETDRARAAFDAAVIEATEAIISDPEMAADNMRWMRRSHDAIEEHRDGLTYAAAGLSPFTQFLAGLIPLPASLENQSWLAQTRDTHLPSAPVVGLITVKDRYDRAATLAAGRTWQRLHLSAAANGIAMQPLNQPIEMIDREQGHSDRWARRMEALTGREWQATFSFRAGHASEAASPSPRRALKDVVRI